jgi:hypothetical protein
MVIWTLELRGSGTRLILAHNGFSGLRGLVASAILGSGWRKKLITENLPNFLKSSD